MDNFEKLLVKYEKLAGKKIERKSIAEVKQITEQKFEFKFERRLSLLALCTECGGVILRKKTQRKRIDFEYHFCSQKCSIKSQKEGELKRKKEETFLKNYGVKNPSQSKQIKKKRQHTFDRLYQGNPSRIPEIKEKKKQTSLKNYGVEYPNQSSKVRKKTEKTCQEKYGAKSYLETAQCREELQRYSLENYGTNHFMQSKAFLEETFRPAFRKRYGVDYPAQVPGVAEKIRQTCLEKYGVDNALKTQKARTNFYGQLEKSKNRMSSKTEDNFYNEVLKPLAEEKSLTIERHKKVKCWFVDFYIPEKELFIQFDGKFWHGKTKTIQEIKRLVGNYGKTSLWSGVLTNFYKDQKQDKWFKKANKKLVRVYDEEYLYGNIEKLKKRILNASLR